jgi:surface carbohydrate biosynthesis protein
MNIYLPIEVKLRELEGKMLLAMVAAERGHVVIIGEKKDTLNLAKAGKLPPGVVHDKSLTPGEYKIKNFKDLKHHRHIITAQDEESGLLDESFDRFAQQRFSSDTLTLVDRVFAWGEHDATSLKKNYPDFTDRIVTVGSPRVDFWSEDFDSYFSLEAKRVRPYIFVSSNFGFPIDENPFWNKVARLRKAGYFDRDPEMEQFMYENTAYQYRLLYHFIKVVRKLSKDFPEIDILVRPHPVESIDAWNKLMGEYPNVDIERKGTISRWIRNALVLMHNGCTSALEAAVSNIPRIAYRPIPHEIEREIPNITSLNVFSYEELKKNVKDLIETGNFKELDQVHQRTKKIISERFSITKGRMAAEKIVDEWESLSNSSLNQFTVKEFMDLKARYDKAKKHKNIKSKVKRKLVDIRNFILGQSRKKANGNLLKTKHKFPYLNENEVNDIIENVQKTLDRYQSVSSVKFGQNSYIIFNKDQKDENIF